MKEDQKHFEQLFYRAIPEDGEALSSFLYRIAAGNGIKYNSLFKIIFDRNNHYAFDLDLNVNSRHIKKASSILSIDESSIMKMTCVGIGFNLSKKVLRKSLFPIRTGGKNSGYQYCNNCKRSYFRLIDRFIFIAICTDCGAFLSSKCSFCQSTVNFRCPRSRHSLTRSITTCSTCFQSIYAEDATFASPNQVYFQNKLFSVIMSLLKSQELANEFIQELTDIILKEVGNRHANPFYDSKGRLELLQSHFR